MYQGTEYGSKDGTKAMPSFEEDARVFTVDDCIYVSEHNVLVLSETMLLLFKLCPQIQTR